MQARIITSITIEQLQVPLPDDVVVSLVFGAVEPQPPRSVHEPVERVSSLRSHNVSGSVVGEIRPDRAHQIFAHLVKEQTIGHQYDVVSLETIYIRILPLQHGTGSRRFQIVIFDDGSHVLDRLDVAVGDVDFVSASVFGDYEPRHARHAPAEFEDAFGFERVDVGYNVYG